MYAQWLFVKRHQQWQMTHLFLPTRSNLSCWIRLKLGFVDSTFKFVKPSFVNALQLSCVCEIWWWDDSSTSVTLFYVKTQNFWLYSKKNQTCLLFKPWKIMLMIHGLSEECSRQKTGAFTNCRFEPLMTLRGRITKSTKSPKSTPCFTWWCNYFMLEQSKFQTMLNYWTWTSSTNDVAKIMPFSIKKSLNFGSNILMANNPQKFT